MSHYLDLLAFVHRADTQLVLGACTGILLILWVAARRAGTAAAIPTLAGTARGWRVLGIGVPALAVASTVVSGDAATIAATWVGTTIVATELALRIADRTQAWRPWGTAQVALAMVVLVAVTRSPYLPVPPSERGDPWAPLAGIVVVVVACRLLHHPPPGQHRRAWIGALVLGGFVLAVGSLHLRLPFDPWAAVAPATAPADGFAVHELEARADFLAALDELHHAPRRLPADVDRLRPFDANLAALAATLTVDALDDATRDELRRTLPLAELLARRSEPAALLVAAVLHFDEIRGRTLAAWRAELEHRWNQALAAPCNRLVQMMQVLTAAIRSHESDFPAGRREQVQTQLRRLWRHRLAWRGYPAALPGFASQPGIDLYDPCNTSAAVRLAQAYGWPEGTDPRLLAHGLRAAHGEPLLAAFVSPPRPGLHDAATLLRLAALGPAPGSAWSFLRHWREAWLPLLPLLATWAARQRLRRRFPHGAPTAVGHVATAPLPATG